jgi:hypothetical protein
MRFQRSRAELIQRVYRDFNEFREVIRDSIIPPNILLLGMDGSVLLSIPQWEGFSRPSFWKEHKVIGHQAHWENHIMGGRVVHIILEINWRSAERLRLGFPYPDYRGILDHIWERRAVGLLDRPLKEGLIDPRSRCLFVENLPLWGAEVT